jgi:valyl-tRNA synthetase
MESRFDFSTMENSLYALWEKHDCFNPDRHLTPQQDQHQAVPYSIIMPPPNANDPLHVGHAMFVSLEDILIRYHRMKGDDTVWIPGTDHAGIETQYVFEKKLQKQGKSRFNYDRQTLYQMIWDYVQENSDIAINQIKRLGASADWSRFKFTLDHDVVGLVLDTFKKLHQDDLVYRDLQLVNYCTKCGTSYSELEVDHQEQKTPLYYIKYPLVAKADSASTPQEHQEYLEVATVRPEPIFVDTHLAVNPTDPKRKHLIGRIALNPLTNAQMPIIGDEFVDPEFGTGIVKLTPAHDPGDFAVAKKHNLPIIQGINQQGKIMENGGEYAGLSILEARKKVVADLVEKGLLDQEKTNNSYGNRVGTCYRCSRIIEPLPMVQFFVKVNDPKRSLTQAALRTLDTGATKIHGAGREKILRHWLTNLNDWNISRQIVWGIRMPVWYQTDGFEENINIGYLNESGKYQQRLLSDILASGVSFEKISQGLQQIQPDISVPYLVSTTMPAAPGAWLQETDTFDTWFSSAQWPVVTLKTNQPQDFGRFYPTSTMNTGYDILPFWVMRMMLMGLYLTNQEPFKDVYLHGLVRDHQGQKMSKSKGNTINPLETIEKFGTDALRLALVIRSTPGLDKSVGEPDFKAARNFANKVWNAARYVLTQETSASDEAGSQDDEYYHKLDWVIEDVTSQLDKLQIGLAADTLYTNFWHWFCDDCIEQTKKGEISQTALLKGLEAFIKLLHPFMPFVTEAIWQEMVSRKLTKEELLIVASWPSRLS